MKLKNFEQQESFQYRKGIPVELKQEPGKICFIEEYDPMMVPPIWIVDDPKPHYPEELNLKSSLFCVLFPDSLQAA